MYDAANSGLDQIIDRTRAQLARYRAVHQDGDELFIRSIVHQFVLQAAAAPPGAGSVNMGLSAYRLAIQQIEIDDLRYQVAQLKDAVEMRDAALKLMWAIRDDEVRP